MNDEAQMTKHERNPNCAIHLANRRAPFFRHSRFVIVSSFVIRHSSFAQAPQAEPTAIPIKDIAPPVDVLPWPMWMVWTAATAALVFIGLLGWLAFRLWKRRPLPPPPTPREIALADLEKAKAQIHALDPHTLSILVSDVLRRYVSAQFNLRATQQTSPEFLASIAELPRFSDAEKMQLAEFLEKCDLIKFAHVETTVDDNSALLDQAVLFVKGGAQ
jgi:hypothetical protein